MKLFYVHPEHVANLWDRVEPVLAKANDKWQTTETAKTYLLNGDWLMWIATEAKEIHGVLCVSFVQFPEQGKVLRLEVLAGQRMEGWVDYLPVIEEWAELNGCVGVDLFGRKGWEKYLKNRGYEFDSVLIRKRLT